MTAKREARDSDAVALAWMVAVLSRSPKIKPLTDYLGSGRPKPKMTLDEVMGRWKALEMAGFGVTVTDLTGEAVH